MINSNSCFPTQMELDNYLRKKQSLELPFSILLPQHKKISTFLNNHRFFKNYSGIHNLVTRFFKEYSQKKVYKNGINSVLNIVCKKPPEIKCVKIASSCFQRLLEEMLEGVGKNPKIVKKNLTSVSQKNNNVKSSTSLRDKILNILKEAQNKVGKEQIEQEHLSKLCDALENIFNQNKDKHSDILRCIINEYFSKNTNHIHNKNRKTLIPTKRNSFWLHAYMGIDELINELRTKKNCPNKQKKKNRRPSFFKKLGSFFNKNRKK